MNGKTTKDKLDHHTQEFLQEKCGMSVSEAEVEEIRRSLVQYCQVLLEIHADITRETKDEN